MKSEICTRPVSSLRKQPSYGTGRNVIGDVGHGVIHLSRKATQPDATQQQGNGAPLHPKAKLGPQCWIATSAKYHETCLEFGRLPRSSNRHLWPSARRNLLHGHTTAHFRT